MITNARQLKAWARANRPLVEALLAARVFATMERERVDAYTRPIFDRYAFYNDLTDRSDGSRITDPDKLYMSDDDELAAAYYAECDVAHRAHGWTGERGTCPALVADTLVIKAENLLIDAGAPLVGEAGPIYNLDLRKRFLDLMISVALSVPGRSAAEIVADIQKGGA